MRILGSILGRRQASPVYRTIDGGHPAPYPDMTDEQLYNYETTFNVARRTFAHPPRPVHATIPQQSPFIPRIDIGQIQAHVEAQAQAQAQTQAYKRVRRTSVFDAPRYTARKAAQTDGRQEAGQPALDFSRPVRTITTKQPVDIVTTRARHPIYKVHGYIGEDDVLTVFTLDGRLCENGPHFLENVPEPTRLHLNVYKQGNGAERYRITQHASREEADAAAEEGRVACVDVKIES